MSVSIWYTIRKNKKEYFSIDTLFFGKQRTYDYKSLKKGLIFDSYDDALSYFNLHNLSFKVYHIRKTIECGSGLIIKDYIYRRFYD